MNVTIATVPHKYVSEVDPGNYGYMEHALDLDATPYYQNDKDNIKMLCKTQRTK